MEVCVRGDTVWLFKGLIHSFSVSDPQAINYITWGAYQSGAFGASCREYLHKNGATFPLPESAKEEAYQRILQYEAARWERSVEQHAERKGLTLCDSLNWSSRLG